jgi:tetratricopeptide (TPR) repeat protein
MRKFVRRHRVGVVATALVFFALVVGLTGATIGMIRATKAERQVRAEAAKAKAINEFLQDMLGSADPRFGLGRDVTVVEALDSASGKIDMSFRDEPEIGAAVRHTIGTTYRNLGLSEQAAELLRSALEMRKETLGSLHPDVVESLRELANAESYRGDKEEAKVLFREALSISENFSGNERLKRAHALNDLANIILDEGDKESAKQLYSESYAIFRDIEGSESHFALVVLHNLASAVHRSGDYDSAESLFREALQGYRKTLGEEHPDIAMAMTNLANVLYDKEDYEAAEDLHRRAVSMAAKLEGDSNPSLRFKLSSLAKVLLARGKHEEAVSVFDQSLEIGRRGIKQEEETRDANRRSWFGSIMREFNYFEQAEHYLVAALDVQMTHLGKNDEKTQQTIGRFLELYEAWDKPEKAAEYRAMLAEK